MISTLRSLTTPITPSRRHITPVPLWGTDGRHEHRWLELRWTSSSLYFSETESATGKHELINTISLDPLLALKRLFPGLLIIPILGGCIYQQLEILKLALRRFVIEVINFHTSTLMFSTLQHLSCQDPHQNWEYSSLNHPEPLHT